MTQTHTLGSPKDYLFGAVSGFLIGLLLLPILATSKPSLFESLKWVLVPLFTVLVLLGLIVASWISQKIPVMWQLAKFVVIGVLNTLVDLGVLAFLFTLASKSQASIAPNDIIVTLFFPLTFFLLYKSFSFIVANINSYFWNKYWTFHVNDAKQPATEFTQFFLVSFFGFLINVTVSSVAFASFHTLGHFSANQWGLIGAVIGSISGLAWNFIGYKFFVFKRSEVTH